MSLKTKIVNDQGKPWTVDREGNGVVAVATHPPLSENIIGLPFRRYFTDSAGAIDMRANGSLVSPVEFSVSANDEYDIWIKSINIKLQDGNARFDLFGNLPALTNGVEIVWQSQEIGEFVIHDGIKDNLEFFRLGGQTPTIIQIAGAGSDAIIVQVDMFEIFSPPFGLRLKKGTSERIVMRVRDDITGVDAFDVIAYGVNIVAS